MYKHLFFDMDQTIAPSRQPILPEMFSLLNSLPQDIIIVSGQTVEKIQWQSNNLPAIVMGQNGNHAVGKTGEELWQELLSTEQRQEILEHIEKLKTLLDKEPNPDWAPIEDRGSQITFSPVGNTAPVELKKVYDPDMRKRFGFLEKIPFVSEDLVVKIGGSTSLDYFQADKNKGTNIQKLLDLKGWSKDESIYFGDGLFPGGNDEAVIGVIETVAVTDHLDTFKKLKEIF